MAINRDGYRHDHRQLKWAEYAFDEARAKKAARPLDCKECWATQFKCPCCGPCTNGMVMTTKSCLLCQGILVRLIINEPRCRYHAKENAP